MALVPAEKARTEYLSYSGIVNAGGTITMDTHGSRGFMFIAQGNTGGCILYLKNNATSPYDVVAGTLSSSLTITYSSDSIYTITKTSGGGSYQFYLFAGAYDA